MSISSADFRRDNQILFQTKIVHQGWDKDHISKCLDIDKDSPALQSEFKDADVIDINKDGRGNTSENYGILQSDMFFTEPVLADGYENIKKAAEQRGDEVVTRETAGDVKMKDQGVIVSEGFYQSIHASESYIRSLDNLVHDLAPKEENAKWAIDTTTQEFMIFKPKYE
jgi:hypothetical protein